ncbi:MAG: hypothetical protein M1812_006275 [Candelaria pacifica]|nr:MAG: hypothetical protein M1812_006275 [Candelaria pacifica]
MPRTRSQKDTADSPLKSLSATKKPRAPRKKKGTTQPAPPQEPSPPASADEQEQEESHSKSQSPSRTLSPPSHTTSFSWPTSTQVAFGRTQVNHDDASTQTDLNHVVDSDALILSENPINQKSAHEPEVFRKLTRSQLIDIIVKLRASSASCAASEEVSLSNSRKRKSADDTDEDTGHRTIRRRRESNSPQPTINTNSARQVMMSESQKPSNAIASIRRRRPLPVNRTPIQPRTRRPQSESTRRFLLTAANVRMTEELDSDDDGIPIDDPPRPPRSSHLFPDADSLKYISGNAERFRQTDPKDEKTSHEHVSPEHTSPKYASPLHSSPGYTSRVSNKHQFQGTSTKHLQQVDQQGIDETSTIQVPETPRTGGWGFGALVNSVPRAISKFIPGLQQQQQPEIAVVSNDNRSTDDRSELLRGTEKRADSSAAEPRNPSTPAVQFTSRQQAPKTAPSNRRSADVPSAPATVGPARQFQPPRRTAHERDLILQKKQRADQARNDRFEEVRQARESRKHERSLQTPGSKRKRSPDVIPNPKGCSYGLDPAFFEDDTTDEELDEDMADHSPANQSKERDVMAQNERRSKRARVSDSADDGDKPVEFQPTTLTQTPRQPYVSSAHTPYTPPTQIFGDPHRARPYTGTMFAGPKDQKTYYGGNVFSESQQHKAASSQATNVKKPNQDKAGPTTARRPSFAVPEDSDNGNDQVLSKSTPKDSVIEQSTIGVDKSSTSKGETNNPAVAEDNTDGSGPKTPNIFGQAFGKRKDRPIKPLRGSVKMSEQPIITSNSSPQTSNKPSQSPTTKSDTALPTQSLSRPQPNPPIQPSPSPSKLVSQAAKPALTSTPPVAPSTTAAINTPVAPSTPSITQASTTSTATPSTNAASEPTKPVAKTPVTWTQPPPARPTPAHALLPIANPSGPSSDEALARARSQAEKYKPKQPSGLRASSRLSTSTVGSDINEENDGMTEAQRQEVEDAVNAIPESELLQFTFPAALRYPWYDQEVEDAVTADRAAMTPEQLEAERQTFLDNFTAFKIRNGYAV